MFVKEPFSCDGPSTWYAITSKKAYHIPSWWNGTKYKDGPGGSMTVSVTKSGTVSSEITGSIEWSSNAIIAKAKASVSVKIGASVSVTTGHNYTHNIHSNKYGHLQYGSWGYKLTGRSTGQPAAAVVAALNWATAQRRCRPPRPAGSSGRQRADRSSRCTRERPSPGPVEGALLRQRKRNPGGARQPGHVQVAVEVLEGREGEVAWAAYASVVRGGHPYGGALAAVGRCR